MFTICTLVVASYQLKMSHRRIQPFFSPEATLEVNTGFSLWANISLDACTMVLSRISSSFFISAQYKYGVLKVYSSSSFCFLSLSPLMWFTFVSWQKKSCCAFQLFLMDHYVHSLTTNSILFLLITQMKYTAIIRSDGYIKCFTCWCEFSFSTQ